MSQERETDYWQDEPIEEVETPHIDEGEPDEKVSETVDYDDTVEYIYSANTYEGTAEYSNFEDDEQVSLFDDDIIQENEQEPEESLEEVRQAMKPSRFKFINTIKEQIAEEIVETTEQFISEDDEIYQEKIARDELFLRRMLIVAGVVVVIIVILAIISLLLS